MLPLTFIAHYRVHPGRMDELQALATEYASTVERTEPGCVSLGLYFEGDSRFCHVVTLQDTETMDQHVVQVHSFLERSADLVEPATLTVYGSPGPVLQAALESNAARGADTAVVSDSGLGFVRHGAR